MQHKNFNMYWDYWNSPRHPVDAERFEMGGRNNIIPHYNYRVDPKLGKGVCAIRWIPCACPLCVAQLDKYWLPNCDPPSQIKYTSVGNFYYKNN